MSRTSAIRFESEATAVHVFVEDSGDRRDAEQLEYLYDIARIVVECIEDVGDTNVDASFTRCLGRQLSPVVPYVAVDVAQHFLRVAAAQRYRGGSNLDEQNDVRDPRLRGVHHRRTGRDRVASITRLDRDGHQELLERNIVFEQVVEELIRDRRKIVEVGKLEVVEAEISRELVERDLVREGMTVSRGKGRLAEGHVEYARDDFPQPGHVCFEPVPRVREQGEILIVQLDHRVEECHFRCLRSSRYRAMRRKWVSTKSTYPSRVSTTCSRSTASSDGSRKKGTCGTAW